MPSWHACYYITKKAYCQYKKFLSGLKIGVPIKNPHATILLTLFTLYAIIFVNNELAEDHMEPKDYKVARIEGEYAILVDMISGDELFIAMALLPMGTDVGSLLHYEMLEYTLVG